ncbi:hypothetical protein KQH42_26605 [Streptomyces sp. CHA1]|uniref:hypothetical protein n=1 Tax=Streptomyces TaxID=1883 RepID=UPI00053E8321|nr:MULTISPECIES: hypothetical protein [unclassified Streptomyces]QPA02192.1 hypothetical protein DI273_27965 [Streptomyces violascens]UYM23246.1 hypothetical protein NQP46_04085 [Streptomyces albus]WDV33783.1 hypothetical protein OIM90_28530 [Streptomyces sp. AD16]MBP3080939.1 hypothetical protein [Streptomyces sp. 604F]MBT3160019.1 hypothetical protein [Streptomyces sp. G11C]
MQSAKRSHRAARSRQQPAVELVPDPVEESEEELDAYETFGMFRVVCPDCTQPIALLADEETLPQHALCATPWDPFGLTVCSGTGRPAGEALPAGEETGRHIQDAAVLLTLPQTLDWRTQPFSHVGGPGSRPIGLQRVRGQAA